MYIGLGGLGCRGVLVCFIGSLGCRSVSVRVSEIVSGMLCDYESQINTSYTFEKLKTVN